LRENASHNFSSVAREEARHHHWDYREQSYALIRIGESVDIDSWIQSIIRILFGLSSYDGAQRLAYYIGWALRPEYQMARFHNAPETKLTDITARIKAIGKTCGRPRLASPRFLCRHDPLWVESGIFLVWHLQSAHHAAADFVTFIVKCMRFAFVARGWCALKVTGRWIDLLFRYRLNDDISRVVMAAVTEAIPIIDDFAADV